MSPVLDAVQAAAVRVVTALGPTATAALIGAFTGIMAALVMALVARALVRAWGRRRVRVSSLAARGATRAEIARRTGISQDAVGMLLHTTTARRGRRNLPLPARIAAPSARERRVVPRDLKLEVFEGSSVRPTVSHGRESARRLPSPTATTNRLTRSGRVA